MKRHEPPQYMIEACRDPVQRRRMEDVAEHCRSQVDRTTQQVRRIRESLVAAQQTRDKAIAELTNVQAALDQTAGERKL